MAGAPGIGLTHRAPHFSGPWRFPSLRLRIIIYVLLALLLLSTAAAAPPLSDVYHELPGVKKDTQTPVKRCIHTGRLLQHWTTPGQPCLGCGGVISR